MALVRHVCGQCGGEVQRSDARCTVCGSSLEWDEPRREVVQSSGAKNAKRKGAAPPVRRKVELWQVIAFGVIGALLAFLTWTELTREQRPAVAQAPAQMPLSPATPAVDLAPLEAAVAANPKDPGTHLRLANGLHDLGMLPRAIEQYNVYLKMHPDDPDARVDLGICYDQMGLMDSVQADRYFGLAIQEMQTVVKAHPTHQPAAFNLGIVHLHRGDLENSNKWLKKAVEVNKNSELGMRAQRMLQQHSFTP
jgi:tetratricopeptide (TPR) repeat protein